MKAYIGRSEIRYFYCHANFYFSVLREYSLNFSKKGKCLTAQIC